MTDSLQTVVSSDGLKTKTFDKISDLNLQSFSFA